jgi:spore coat polysaccharide biosynthesis protein SpsF
MNDFPVLVVVQARMDSSRLPGKIAAPLGDLPLLGRVVRRLQAAEAHFRPGLRVLVATTTNTADDVTASLCNALQVDFFRGSEEDVLDRYLAATAHLDDDRTMLRATADNPLYCPVRTAKIILHHLAGGGDYTSIEDLSYVVPEVMRVGALRAMARRATAAFCREHVTPYFRQHPEEFRVTRLSPTWEGLRPEIRLTVDTPEELQQMAAIYEALGRDNDTFSLEQVYEFCERRPLVT